MLLHMKSTWGIIVYISYCYKYICTCACVCFFMYTYLAVLCSILFSFHEVHWWVWFVFTFIIGVYSTAERKRSCSQQDGPVNGFHNNFGHSIGGVGYRGEEGVLIANILKPFVSKCVDNARELYGSDNIVCRIVHS